MRERARESVRERKRDRETNQRTDGGKRSHPISMKFVNVQLLVMSTLDPGTERERLKKRENGGREREVEAEVKTVNAIDVVRSFHLSL